MPIPQEDLDAYYGTGATVEDDAASVVGAASATNPDQEANRRRTAADAGVDAIVRGGPEFDRMIQQGAGTNRARERLAGAPRTSEYLARPGNAEVAHDDVENLSWWEQVLNYKPGPGVALSPLWRNVPALASLFGGTTGGVYGRYVAENPEEVGADLANAPRAFSEGMEDVRFNNLASRVATGQASAVERQEFVEWRDRRAAAAQADTRPKPGPFSTAARTAPQILEGISQSGPEMLLGGSLWAGGAVVAGQMGPQVALPEEIGTVPAAAFTGAMVGLRVGYGKTSFRQNSGAAYAEFSVMTGADGKPLDEGAVRMAALASGAVTAGLDTLGFESLLNLAGVRNLSKDGIAELMRRPEVVAALSRVAQKYGVMVASEASTEAVQEAVQILAGEALRMQQGEAPGTTMAEAGERVTEAFVQGGQAAAVLGAPAGVVGTAVEVNRAKRQREIADQQQTLFDAIGENAENSRLRERLPEDYRAFVDEVTRNGPVANVYVDAQALTELFQSQGLDPVRGAAEMGITADDLATAQASGGMVTITTGTYAAKIAGTPLDAGLRPHMAFSPEAMTQAQAEAAEAAAPELDEAQRLMAEEEAALDVAETAAVTQMRERYTAEISKDPRFTPSQVAAIVAFRVESDIAQARDRGITVEQYTAQFPPERVVATPPVAARSQVRVNRSAGPTGPLSSTISSGAQAAGVSSAYMTALAGKESSFNPNAGATTSSAVGLYQFIDGTWIGTMRQHGTAEEKRIAATIRTGRGGRAIITNEEQRAFMASRTDPATSTRMAAALTSDNARVLRTKLGRDPTDAELYMAHFIGSPAKVADFLKADPFAPADQFLPAAARSNRSIFYNQDGTARTVGQVRERLSKGFDGTSTAPAPGGFQTVDDAKASISSIVPGAVFTSGFRTKEHNAEVGGAENSYHTRGVGQALDITPPPGMTMAQLHAKLKASGIAFTELINEGDHVHVAWEPGTAAAAAMEGQGVTPVTPEAAPAMPEGAGVTAQPDPAAPALAPLVDAGAEFDALVAGATPGQTQAQAATQPAGVTQAQGMVAAMSRPAPEARASLPDLATQVAEVAKTRTAKAQPTGPSLSQFIAAQGGIADTGGEFAAIDADKGKRGKHRITRKEGGITAGDMAQRAVEAGYFPDMAAEASLDGPGLIEAVRAEQAGKPRFANQAAPTPEQERADSLRDEIDRRGIAWDAEPAEIARQLKEARDEDDLQAAIDEFESDAVEYDQGGMPDEQQAFILSRSLAEGLKLALDVPSEIEQSMYPPPLAMAIPNPVDMGAIADVYDAAPVFQNSPRILASYRLLIDYTLLQLRAITGNVVFEPWTGKGEPYANSAEMMDDVAFNRHLWFYRTENGFGEGEDTSNHPLLEVTDFMGTDGKPLLANDAFRVVHDFFGHTQRGLNFGPVGELNAFLEHAAMFPSEAWPALAVETLMQNAWVNFGPHMRRADGSFPIKGDLDYVPLPKRRFADQKVFWPGTEIISRAFDLQRKANDAASRETRRGRLEEDRRGRRGDASGVAAGQAQAEDLTPEVQAMASWTPARITNLLQQFGYSHAPGRTKAYATRISPDQFLGLTASAEGRRLIELETAPLDEDELATQEQTPYLIYNTITGGIAGHEGRHRMTALKLAGISDVPVVIVMQNDGGGLVREPLPALEARPQRMSVEVQSGDEATTLNRLVPISYDYERTLNEEFGGEGRVLFQERPDLFYSALRRAVEGSKTAKASPRQWIATLQNTPGVKKEELEWTGALDYLAAEEERMTLQITREDLAAFVEQNGVKVEEVVLGDGGDYDPPWRDVEERADELLDESDWEFDSDVVPYPEVTQDENGRWLVDGVDYLLSSEDSANALAQEYHDDAVAEAEREARPAARSRFENRAENELIDEARERHPVAQFSDWKLPGGENYREVLLVLPEPKGRAERRSALHRRWHDLITERDALAEDDPRRAELGAEIGRVQDEPDWADAKRMTATHWEQPNVIAHTRLTDRTDADGKRVLFVEEVQSDWHQKGRDQGYARQRSAEEIEAADAAVKAIEREYLTVADDLLPSASHFINSGKTAQVIALADETSMIATSVARYRAARQIYLERPTISAAENYIGSVAAIFNWLPDTLRAEGAVAASLVQHAQPIGLRAQEARIQRSVVTSGTGIPDAPFKTAWPALVMKRIIRLAAEEGYDRVAWTTGQQQADRYDLATHVAEISFEPSLRGANAEGFPARVFTVNPAGQTGLDRAVQSREELAELLGVNIATNLMEAEAGENGYRAIRGLDIQVGGEGMRAFYDRNLVNITNDIIKKHGVRVSQVGVQFERNKGGVSGQDALRGRGVWEDDIAETWEAMSNAERDEAIEEQRQRVAGIQNQPGFDMTESLVEAALGGFSLFQDDTAPGPKRGSVAFPAGGLGEGRQATIKLFEGADLSTFLHETGHVFLERLIYMAGQPDAPQHIRDRMNTILQWMNVPDASHIGVKEHEMWAEAFEQYLMDGKSPSLSLRSAFEAFRSWLVFIYRRVRMVSGNLTPEIRDVMDRMVATEEAINLARAESGQSMTAADLGLPPEQAAVYERAQQDAIAEAQGEADRRVLEAVRRQQQAWWKAERARVREETDAAVAGRPVYRAFEWLAHGRWLNAEPPEGLGEVKLDRAAIAADYGPETLDRLPQGAGFARVYAEDGTHPDVVAEVFGFDTGGELINALATMEKRAAVVERETDEAMAAAHPDPMEDLPDIALEATHNVSAERVLEIQYQAMSGRPLHRGIAEAARLAQRSRSIRDLKSPDKHLVTERRAANKAIAAFKKGDKAEGAKQKYRQIVAFHTWREARNARDRIEKAEALFLKITGGKQDSVAKSRNMDLVQAARAILAAYGYSLQRNNPLHYMALVREYDPALADTLEPMVQDATEGATEDTDAMTFDEFMGLYETVDALWKMSRSSKQVEIEGRKIELDEATAALSDQVYTRLGEGPNDSPTKAMTEGEKILRGISGWRAALRRVESWAVQMDNGATGPFTRMIWRTISMAADAHRAYSGEVRAKLAELMKGIEPGMSWKKIAAPELNHVFADKIELLHALLHTGNDSNKRKLLLGGRGKGAWASTSEDTGELDTRRWDKFVNRMIADGTLTKADFDFAQGVWDLLDSMKAGAQATHRKVFGRYFDEVTAHSFSTPWGEYRGGYVPAQADVNLVQDADLRAEMEKVNESASFMFPTTPKGFTKGRQENYTKPLALDLRLLAQHIDKVSLFTHMTAPVRDVQRMLMAPAVKDALFAYDPVAAKDMLIPWLNRSARQIVMTPFSGAGGQLADRVLRGLRSRASLQIMVGNLVNAMQQITGFSLTMVKVKPHHLAKALAVFVKAPSEVANTISAASPMMRERLKSQSIEAALGMDEILIKPNLYQKAKRATSKHGYFLQHAFQNTVDIITWLGANSEALADGVDDADAARHADAMVRQTQGSMNPEDLARFEAGNGLSRLFTTFASYFNMQGNLLWTEGSLAVEQKQPKRLAWVILMGFTVTALVADAIRKGMTGGFDDDEEDGYLDEWLDWFVGSQARGLLAMVPGVGPAAVASINAFNDKPYDDKMSLSPAVSAAEAAARTPANIYNLATGEGDASRTVKDTLTLLGLATGLPFGALARPASYAADVAEGDVEPQNAVDAARGTITGNASPNSKMN